MGKISSPRESARGQGAAGSGPRGSDRATLRQEALTLGSFKQFKPSFALARHGMEASPTQHATQPEPKELEKGVAELVVKLLKTLRCINSLGLAWYMMTRSAHFYTALCHVHTNIHTHTYTHTYIYTHLYSYIHMLHTRHMYCLYTYA